MDSRNSPDDDLYAFLGRFVIIFQWMELKFDEIFFLYEGQKNRQQTFKKIAKLRFAGKQHLLRKIIEDYCEGEPTKSEWLKNFVGVDAQITNARKLRNSLLHSSYLLDFVEIDGSILKVDMRERKNQQWLNSENMDQYETQVAEAAVALNFTHVQLVHWADSFQGNLTGFIKNEHH